MERFTKSDGPRPRIAAGAYTSRMLKKAALIDLYLIASQATTELKSTDRTLQDEEDLVGESYADREIAEMRLDGAARLTLNLLKGTSESAEHSSPYIDIAPDGLTGLTTAKVGERSSVFNRFVNRLEAYLPTDDPIRIQQVPVLQERIADWDEGRETIDDAIEKLEIVARTRQKAIEAWDAAMETVYGQLLSKVGRKDAERFFKHRASKSKASKEESSTSEVGEPAQPAPVETAPNSS